MSQRLRAGLVAVAVGPAGPGCTACLTTREVVRADEPRRTVTFASPAVAERFNKAVEKLGPKQVAGRYVGPALLPVYLYGREGYLSENGRFNDAFAACDTDGDGVLTAAEVEAYERPG